MITDHCSWRASGSGVPPRAQRDPIFCGLILQNRATRRKKIDMNQSKTTAELHKINQAIAAQEALRGTLPDAQVDAALTPLRQKQAELTAQLATQQAPQKTIHADKATADKVEGDKISVGDISNAQGVAIGPEARATVDVQPGAALAQGTAAKAVAERGVLVEGDVSGSIITGDQSGVGGIRANRIEAENVVQGMQQLGGDLTNAADAAILAEALSRGSITADSIQAQNVVAGFQYIADPALATPDELRQEVAALQEQLAAAIAAGELEPNGDMEDAQNALAAAETELAGSQPQGSRVVRKLKEAADILTESAKATAAASKAGLALVKLAPVAAALYQIATNIFGG